MKFQILIPFIDMYMQVLICMYRVFQPITAIAILLLAYTLRCTYMYSIGIQEESNGVG